ncbi:MAG TPA: NAD(P)-dependent alcohol dehydrogenase [Clostridia bacterium]|nr:NAD(P)-dependent alcohol dehydrogenase [Clostridia bacterium]
MKSKVMKAMVRITYGNPEVISIKKIDRPEPTGDKLLIKNHVTTVNRTDCAILRGKPWIMRIFQGIISPKKIVTGTDFSGEIIAVGNEVINFKKGDRVFGFDDSGLQSHAEYLIVSESQSIDHIPDMMSYQSAVTALEGPHYAYNFIKTLDIKKGDKVLVNGASGAIGSSLVQLLKYFEASVTAVCSTKNISLMEELDANYIIDYTNKDFTKVEKTYDYVLDAVGKSSFNKCKPILKEKGVYISSELGRNFQNLFYALITPILGGKKVIFPVPRNIEETLVFMRKLIKMNQFKGIIDRVYTLDEISEAYKYVLSGHKTGNVIITFDEENSLNK